jgi:hypothetical protein
MKKSFKMRWTTLEKGVRAMGNFEVLMTQAQWESIERREITQEALSKLGLSTQAYPPRHLKYCVVSQDPPKKSPQVHQAIVAAIRRHSMGSGFEENRYFYCYPELSDQENATGTVLVDGVEYYFRNFGGAGLCDYSETLKQTEHA